MNAQFHLFWPAKERRREREGCRGRTARRPAVTLTGMVTAVLEDYFMLQQGTGPAGAFNIPFSAVAFVRPTA